MVLGQRVKGAGLHGRTMVTKPLSYRWLGTNRHVCAGKQPCVLCISPSCFIQIYFLFSVYAFECMYVYHIHAGTLASQKTTLDSLDLEL